MDKALYDAIGTVLNDAKLLKVSMSDILPAAIAVAAGTCSDFEIENRVLENLEKFEKEEKIKLPSKKGKRPGWPKSAVLPLYVTAIKAEDAKKKKREQKKVIEDLRNKTPWEPTRMIAFAGNLKTLRELKLAKVINDYLRFRKADEEALPHRERALRIFGDEKALDAYVHRGLFNGRIALSDLDSFYCPEPLPFEPLPVGTQGSPESLTPSDRTSPSDKSQPGAQRSAEAPKAVGKPLLIVENSNTYWSCCQANRILCFFAGVIYGKGFSVSNSKKAVDGLQAIEEQLGSKGIWYFGDLDPAGLSIPEKINRHREEEGLCSLIPAIPLYRALIRKGLTTGYTQSTKATHTENFPKEWLGEEILSPYLALSATCRWPQEGLSARDIIDAMKC